MKRLAILGASGHGKVVADTAECCGWHTVDFFDDRWPGLADNGPWPVVGDSAALLARLGDYGGVLVAIGNNGTRHDKLRWLQAHGATLARVVHPAAYLSRHAELGAGSVVFAGAVVNAGARIGTGAIINTGASVDHDCSLGEAVHISPGARLAGGVEVGDRAWVGIGACVRQLVRIGAGAVVGAGAAVIADVAPGTTVAGVPARLLRS